MTFATILLFGFVWGYAIGRLISNDERGSQQ